MSVNPLYRDEFFFFSNMYDDSIIAEFYRKISAESYDRSVAYQHNMIGRTRNELDGAIFYKATLKDFVIDDKYNHKHGLSAGSRTLVFKSLIIPVYNTRKYINEYKVSDQKIPLIDFYRRTDIFNKVIILHIGSYRIMNAYLIQNADGSVTLAIENSLNSGIESQYFDKLIAEYSEDEPVWIFSDEITQLYYSNTTTSSSISSTEVNEHYEVRIPIDKAINKISVPTNKRNANSWDCLMTYHSSKYGKQLLGCCMCSLKEMSDTTAVFYVPKKFITMIKSKNSNINMYFINRPNRRHVLYYEHSKSNLPILNLGYSHNPSGNINLEVFEVDRASMCKGRRLYSPEFTQVYFPNIFDFSTLNKNNSDLIIEVIEYDDAYTNQIMRNSLSPLIKSLGSEFYAEYVVNGYDKAIDGTSCNLKSYHPRAYPISFEDYLGSEYYGNIRGYILDKIGKTIHSDPYLLNEYYEWMSNLNLQVKSLSGTPKLFRFGTTKTGEFSGSNTVVTNTSIASSSPDDIQYFDEPHSYITYYSSMKKVPFTAYVNGKYIRPTCVRFFEGIHYLFFPINTINREMSKYSSNDEILAASPITVDIYPSAYYNINETPKDLILIDSMNDIVKLFKHVKTPKFSIDELVAYDNVTGKYLGKLFDLFDINLKVSQFVVKNPNASDSLTISRENQVEYLYTVLNEIYCTSDGFPIILNDSDITLSWNKFIDDLITEGIIDDGGISGFTHKKLNFEDIELIPKDISILGKSIRIYSSEFKHEYFIDGSTGIYNNESDTTSFRLNGLNIDPNMSNYYLYIDGCLHHNAKIYDVSNSYNGDIMLELEGDWTSNGKKMMLVHMPINCEPEDFNITSRVFYMKPAISGETETDKLWPNGDDDGVVLQSPYGNIYNSYPFDSPINFKYTNSGLRLPPKSETTNSLYSKYYNNSRAKALDLKNDDTGIVYFIKRDHPIVDLAKQNPHDTSFDTTISANPLDILTK